MTLNHSAVPCLCLSARLHPSPLCVWYMPLLLLSPLLSQVGAEELAPDEYKAASELRARLTGAQRVKQQLESALKGLASTSLGTGPRGRQLEQLAEPVEAAIREAARYGAGVSPWPNQRLGGTQVLV